MKERFDFPANPAFFHSTVVRKNKKLKSIADYCKEKEIAFNNSEDLIININRTKERHKAWKTSIDKLYRNDVNKSVMNEAPPRLITQNPLRKKSSTRVVGSKPRKLTMA